MENLPDDIYTEPDAISPDTLANLGPLRRLAGIWKSDRGMDTSPEGGGTRKLIMQSLTIPRGQVVLAGGRAGRHDRQITVEARRGDTRFGICSSPFIDAAVRTDYYRVDITFNDDDSWTYVTRTAAPQVQDISKSGTILCDVRHKTGSSSLVLAPWTHLQSP